MKGTVAREGGALHVAEAVADALVVVTFTVVLASATTLLIAGDGADAGAPRTEEERRRATKQEKTEIMLSDWLCPVGLGGVVGRSESSSFLRNDLEVQQAFIPLVGCTC